MTAMDDLCVGLPVQFFMDFDSPPTAAIVTAVGGNTVVSLWVMNHDYVVPINVDGVYHIAHEKAKWSVGNESGIWDFLKTDMTDTASTAPSRKTAKVTA